MLSTVHPTLNNHVLSMRPTCGVHCCDNHLSQGQMITLGVNLLVEVSSGEFTRELDKEPLLN